MKKLATDDEYRRRWVLYFLNDGRIEDSRQKNWREVEWEKLDKIVVSIEGKEHVIEKHPKNHKFFLAFRQAGMEVVNHNTNFVEKVNGVRKLRIEKEYKRIHIWTFGVTDGIDCFLVDIDFYTGTLLRAYQEPLIKYKSHIHPRIKELDRIYKQCLLHEESDRQ